MSIKHLFALAALACLIASCGSKKEPETVAETPKEEKKVPSINRLPEYHFEDDVQVGDRTYHYTLHREAVDSLGSVCDEYGDHYVNTFYELTIRRDGKEFYHKRFTKQTLGSKLSADFRKNGILDGFRFNRAEDGKLIFSLCVSYPDSDLSTPFLLTIGPDGSSTLTEDQFMDVEPEEGV